MAANPPQSATGHEIIEIDSDSTDGETPRTGRRPFLAHSEPPTIVQRLPFPQRQDAACDAYEKCLQAILAVFPDISRDHVQQLWDKSAVALSIGDNTLYQTIHQTLVEKILDEGTYPKERDRLKEQLKKRKRASPEVEAAKWKYADLRHDPIEYARVARARLQEHFCWVPSKFIDESFKEHAHYYGAFFAIDDADRKSVDSINSPFTILKSKRSGQRKSERMMASMEADGYDFEGLKDEIRAAEARWQKEEDNRQAAKECRMAKEALDNEYRQKGETIECVCCFSDDNPPPNMTHCNADEPHFFCFGCAKRNAEIDLASLKYTLRCMDVSRCEATFSQPERARFLDAAVIEKLERLQQQDEIRRAGIGDLESCPFCDYAAICIPVAVDRIFDCQNPGCMEASCRLCREKSHIPLSCEESKKENGFEERHAIEEARTEALVRSCQKCKVRIFKEDGCNKVVCTNCYSVICDYCGEDISKTRYDHFDAEHRGHPTGKTKCPLYDPSNRKEDQIEKAGKEALERVRKENPSLSEEDLKIKFAKSVQDQSKRHRDTVPQGPLQIRGEMHRWRQQAGPPRPLRPPGSGIWNPVDQVAAGLDPVIHRQPLEARQAPPAQLLELMEHGRRVEPGLGDFNGRLAHGDARNRRLFNANHPTMDLEMARHAPLRVPTAQLANGVKILRPKETPLFRQMVQEAIGNKPTQGGMGLMDAQQHRIARAAQDDRPYLPMPLQENTQPIPMAGRPRRDLLDLTERLLNQGGHEIREQDLTKLGQLEARTAATRQDRRWNDRDVPLGPIPVQWSGPQNQPVQGLYSHNVQPPPLRFPH